MSQEFSVVKTASVKCVDGHICTNPSCIEHAEGGRKDKLCDRASDALAIASLELVNLSMLMNNFEDPILPTLQEIERTYNVGDAADRVADELHIDRISFRLLVVNKAVNIDARRQKKKPKITIDFNKS